jgi:hypothetical protein
VKKYGAVGSRFCLSNRAYQDAFEQVRPMPACYMSSIIVTCLKEKQLHASQKIVMPQLMHPRVTSSHHPDAALAAVPPFVA